MSDREKQFRDETVKPVKRRWMCATNGCDGEMRSTGQGMTTMDTHWLHRCDECGREEWAERNYPTIVYLPSEQKKG